MEQARDEVVTLRRGGELTSAGGALAVVDSAALAKEGMVLGRWCECEPCALRGNEGCLVGRFLLST